MFLLKLLGDVLVGECFEEYVEHKVYKVWEWGKAVCSRRHEIINTQNI